MTPDEKYQAAQQRLGYPLDEFKVGGGDATAEVGGSGDRYDCRRPQRLM
ncbi:hypothetical protein [Pseudomonas canadensis]|nr:hypothetical protein [Pseudomonas canadensis]